VVLRKDGVQVLSEVSIARRTQRGAPCSNERVLPSTTSRLLSDKTKGFNRREK